MKIKVLGRISREYYCHTGERGTSNIGIDESVYWDVLDAAIAQKIPIRPHAWGTMITYHFDDGFDYQPVQVAPCSTNSRRVVHVQHADGTTETDAQWWARQGELEDYRQTVDGSSYRGQ